MDALTTRPTRRCFTAEVCLKPWQMATDFLPWKVCVCDDCVQIHDVSFCQCTERVLLSIHWHPTWVGSAEKQNHNQTLRNLARNVQWSSNRHARLLQWPYFAIHHLTTTGKVGEKWLKVIALNSHSLMLYCLIVYLLTACYANWHVGQQHRSITHDRLVGLVVKASASRAGGPGFESR